MHNSNLRHLRNLYDGVFYRRREFGALQRCDGSSLEAPIAQLDILGFLTAADLQRHLRRLRAALRTRPNDGKRLVDLGCGTGGYGAFLSTRLGLPLVGVDFSYVAARTAARRREREGKRSFVVADFAAIALAEAVAGAICSLDALYLAKDIPLALRECGRIAAPGCPLLCTLFVETAKATEERRTWVGCLTAAGFTDVRFDDLTSSWRSHMKAKHGRRWKARDILRRAHGEAIEAELSVSAAMLGLGGRPPFIDTTSRFEAFGTRSSRKLRHG